MAPDSNDTTIRAVFRGMEEVLSQISRPEQILQTILQQAVKETEADRGVFVEVERDGALSFQALHRFERNELEGAPGSFSRSILKEALQSGQVIRIEDAMQDARFFNAESVLGLELASVLCAPIRIDGRVEALVHLEKKERSHFNERHELLLLGLLRFMGPGLKTLRAAERIRGELEESRKDLSGQLGFGKFLGRSPEVQELAELVKNASDSDFPVLITGETGTGKNLLARIIHASSKRSSRGLVTVFCPSLERGMVETELFGHKRGAFTGAESDRVGKIQEAETSTLFLDEIGELPMEIQPKLLRLVDEKVFERVGDPKEHRADIRLIAATNRDLPASIAKGSFRQDLYERLNFIAIRVPALRERREDIPLLLRHALDQLENGRWRMLAPETETWLATLDYSWPGNVRQLEQLAARLSHQAQSGSVTPGEIEKALGSDMTIPPPAAVAAENPEVAEQTTSISNNPWLLPELGEGESLDDGLRTCEKLMIERILAQHPHLSRKEQAQLLGIGARKLYERIKRYGLETRRASPHREPDPPLPDR